MNLFEKIKKHHKKHFLFIHKNRTKILFFLILVIFVFFRFYELPERTILGWDQADSAWAARSIIVENHIKTEGVPIKGNASMTLGPAYYYLITPFYLLTNLDMIASSIFAGIISLLGFFIFYYITKKLFDTPTALVSLLIYSVSISVINFDRIQAAYVLIPIISYVVFYFLYKVLNGNEKFIPALAAIIGFGFHAHFTTIFYPIIILLSVPFFPRTKKALFYTLLSIPIFALFTSTLLYSIFFKNTGSGSLTTYLNESYHGFHLRRFFQITNDAFISAEEILQFKLLKIFAIFITPLFIYIYWYIKRSRNKFIFCYLAVLWIIIPWIIFSTYSGELTNYYFSLPRNIVIAILGYLCIYFFKKKNIIVRAILISFGVAYFAYTLILFNKGPYGNYIGIKTEAKTMIKENKKIQFKDRDPLYYMYFTLKEKNTVKE